MNIKALSFSLILSLLLPFHAAATGNEPIKATVAEAWTRAKAHHDDATRLLRRDLSQQMVELAGAREKQAVVECEIASAQTILRAFEAQQQKGNVAVAEVMRLRSQYVQQHDA